MAARLGRFSLFLAGATIQWAAPLPAPPTPHAVSFQRDIAPIFQQSCAKCHMGNTVMGGLRLDSEAAIVRGGASGPAAIAGKSAESLLVKRILGLTDAPRMPMGGTPLTPSQVALIRRWIDAGKFNLTDTHPVNGDSAASTAGSSTVFASQIRPILASRCYSCHGPDIQQNGLRLDSLGAILKGSQTGEVILPGHSANSRLIRRLEAQE